MNNKGENKKNILDSAENKNIYKILTQTMDKKINKLKKENNIYFDKLYDIINEFFIKYCNILEDQTQKELIVNIFYQINNIINMKDKEILLIKKENENLKKKLEKNEKNNEELVEQNNSLLNKYNTLKNKLEKFNSEIKLFSDEYISKKTENSINDEEIPLQTISSYVNSEELESIRFFDKITMKRHSFYNIPELSFQKIKNEENKNNIIQIKKRSKNKFSYEQNKKIIKNLNNYKNKEINKKIINYNNSNILSKYKKKLNFSYKQNNNSSINKRNILSLNNHKPNNIGYFFTPENKINIPGKK